MFKNLFFSLSDKYEIVSILGTGTFGTVYLARHRLLECFRAIKVIPKHLGPRNTTLSEARLLKSLHHHGIPTLYEIEEDDSYFYLIEEYMEGDTLKDFLLTQKHISQYTFYNFCIQICQIFCYLHSFRPEPILYMDLKPEHIIVCQMQLKLIDFNVSLSLSKSGNFCNLYGNTTYSAPEIKSGAIPSLKWDIYSIGKLFTYLAKFVDIPLSHKTHILMKKAMAKNPADRYETVEQLLFDLNQLQNQINQAVSCKKIIVVGSHSGCGSTHISFSLVSCLNYLGYAACYFEKDNKNNLHTLKNYKKHVKEKNGCFYYKYFHGYPNYGSGISLSMDTSEIQVLDYGDNTISTDELEDADMVLFICSNGIWKRQNAFDKGETFLSLSKNNLRIVCNIGTTTSQRAFSKHFKTNVYLYPLDTSPFKITSNKCKWASQLLCLKRRRALFFHLKKLANRKKL